MTSHPQLRSNQCSLSCDIDTLLGFSTCILTERAPPLNDPAQCTSSRLSTHISRLCYVALLALSLPLAAQTPLPPAITTAEANVSTDAIRAYDKYLSDDLLEGRYPGQRGGELAAKFIATQFASYGLKPGG